MAGQVSGNVCGMDSRYLNRDSGSNAAVPQKKIITIRKEEYYGILYEYKG